MDGLVNQPIQKGPASQRMFFWFRIAVPILGDRVLKAVRARERCGAISMRAALEDSEPALPELIVGATTEPFMTCLVRMEQRGLHVREEGIQFGTGADHLLTAAVAAAAQQPRQRQRHQTKLR